MQSMSSCIVCEDCRLEWHVAGDRSGPARHHRRPGAGRRRPLRAPRLPPRGESVHDGAVPERGLADLRTGTAVDAEAVAAFRYDLHGAPCGAGLLREQREEACGPRTATRRRSRVCEKSPASWSATALPRSSVTTRSAVRAASLGSAVVHRTVPPGPRTPGACRGAIGSRGRRVRARARRARACAGPPATRRPVRAGGPYRATAGRGVRPAGSPVPRLRGLRRHGGPGRPRRHTARGGVRGPFGRDGRARHPAERRPHGRDARCGAADGP